MSAMRCQPRLARCRTAARAPSSFVTPTRSTLRPTGERSIATTGTPCRARLLVGERLGVARHDEEPGHFLGAQRIEADALALRIAIRVGEEQRELLRLQRVFDARGRRS